MLNVLPWFYRLQEEDEQDLYGELRKAAENCEEVIGAEAAQCPGLEGMGTTLTMAYIVWPAMYVVHVGDSRCYLYRDRTLQQITLDHTVAQELVSQGALKPEEARDSQWHHVLTSALGRGAEELSTSVYKSLLQTGDTVLLCTDGLTESLADSEISAILESAASEKAACQRLIDAANEAGGADNITVIVARYNREP